MKMVVELTQDDVRTAIVEFLQNRFEVSIDGGKADLEIRVRSKQNYREKEWENGELKVTYVRQSA